MTRLPVSICCDNLTDISFLAELAQTESPRHVGLTAIPGMVGQSAGDTAGIPDLMVKRCYVCFPKACFRRRAARCNHRCGGDWLADPGCIFIWSVPKLDDLMWRQWADALRKAYAEGQVFDVLIAMHQRGNGSWNTRSLLHINE